MIRYKSNASQWSMTFATSTECDNNVTKHFVTSTDGGRKRVCVKYHNSTTSYGLTTDTTASEYSPRIYINDTNCYFGSQYTIDTTSEMSANVNNTVMFELPHSTYSNENISSFEYQQTSTSSSRTSTTISDPIDFNTYFENLLTSRTNASTSTSLLSNLSFDLIGFTNNLSSQYYNTRSTNATCTFSYYLTNRQTITVDNMGRISLRLRGCPFYNIMAYNAKNTITTSMSYLTRTEEYTETVVTNTRTTYTNTTLSTRSYYKYWYNNSNSILTETTNIFQYMETTDPFITSFSFYFSYASYTSNNTNTTSQTTKYVSSIYAKLNNFNLLFSTSIHPRMDIIKSSDIIFANSLNNISFSSSLNINYSIKSTIYTVSNGSETIYTKRSKSYNSYSYSYSYTKNFSVTLLPTINSYDNSSFLSVETSLSKLHFESNSPLILRNITNFSLAESTSTIQNTRYKFNYTFSYTQNKTYTTIYSQRTGGRFNYDSSTTSAYVTTYTETKAYNVANSNISMYYLESEFITTNLSIINRARSFLCGTSTFYAGASMISNNGSTYDVYYSIVNVAKDNIYDHNDIDFGTYTGKEYYQIKKYNLMRYYTSYFNFYNNNIYGISGSDNTTFEGVINYSSNYYNHTYNVYSSSTYTYYQPITGNVSIVSTSTAYTYNYYSSYYTETVNETVSISRNNNISTDTMSYTSSDVSITYTIDNITVEPSNIYTWNINV